MQETSFARRRLTFFDKQVTFQCHLCSWREDMMNEIPDTSLREPKYSEGKSSQDEALLRYRTTVDGYTNRNLTFDSDIHEAFFGLRELVSAKTGSRVQMGLLENFMDWSILWIGHAVVLDRRYDFPSWSWLGWKGPIWLPGAPQGEKMASWIRDHCWINYSLATSARSNEENQMLLGLKTVTARFDTETPEKESNKAWKYLVDSRGRRCGAVEIHDPIYAFILTEKDVRILVLSGAQPNDVLKIENLRLNHYDDDHLDYAIAKDAPSNTVMAHPATNHTSVKYPMIPCSNLEGTTENGWRSTSQFHDDGSFAREIPSEGIKKLLANTETGDSHTFDYYNVMLVADTDPIRILPPEQDPARVNDCQIKHAYERLGLGLLHYKALRWALEPGPSWEECWIR